MLRQLGVTIVTVVGLTSVSCADENAPKKNHTLRLLQLRDYSVDLKTDKDPTATPGAPSGLAPLAREADKPSVGLSGITRPLSK